MFEHTGDDNLTAALDLVLDQILDDWAEHVWINFNQQEYMVLQDVIVISKDLGYTWWRQLFDQFPFHNTSILFPVSPKVV
jgi:hypothetical protein